MATTEKSEEQIAKERAAVEAMRNAKSNMDAALTRIQDLEAALLSARTQIETFKNFVGKSTYIYGDTRKSCHSIMDEAIATITKILGRSTP